MSTNSGISKPARKEKVITTKGYTPEIIKAILEQYSDFKLQTREYSKRYIGMSKLDALKQIWTDVKKNIRYILDPEGDQKIKSPEVIWWDKNGDCKSYSIFIGSVLYNLGFPVIFRFAAYAPGDVTHVYIVTVLNGQYILMDCCMDRFNIEKKQDLHHIKDYTMTKITKISGIGKNVSPLLGNGNSFNPDMTAGEFQLRIMKQRMEIERELMLEHAKRSKRVNGIAAKKVPGYTSAVEMINDTIDDFQKAKGPEDFDHAVTASVEMIKAGDYKAQGDGVDGIGKLFRSKSQRVATRAKKKEIRKTTSGKDQRQQMAELRRTEGGLTSKILQKAADVAKTGAKALVKVATFPMRLATKGVLEIALPKAAPFFLYLFVAPNLLDRLPAKARAKRKKAEKIADFIVNAVGMKREHFMGLVRNGIMAQQGKAPEVLLQQYMKPGGVKGIGVIPPQVIMFVIDLIKKIAGAFKKNAGDAGDVGPDDAPSPEDFADLDANEQKELGEDIRSQTDEDFDIENPDAGEGDEPKHGGGGRKSHNSFGK